jgi:hypothetical protein
MDRDFIVGQVVVDNFGNTPIVDGVLGIYINVKQIQSFFYIICLLIINLLAIR